GAVTQTGGLHTVDGALTLAANPGSSGSFALQGGQLSTGSVVINQGGTFSAAGRAANIALITPAITNRGTVSLSSDCATQLTQTLLVQSSTGTLNIHIGGISSGQFGQMIVQNAALDGALTVSLDGYEPSVGDSFDILSAATLTGTFATIPPLWRVEYG